MMEVRIALKIINKFLLSKKNSNNTPQKLPIRKKLLLTFFSLSIPLTACDQKSNSSQNLTIEEKPSIPIADVEWPNVGGDSGKTHFSPLSQINRDNAKQLGLAWEFNLGTHRGLEATPIVIDGVMVTSGNLGRVYALDPVSGEELWHFTPKVNMQVNRTACCDQANRGVAVQNERVFVGALDGILYALDLHSGDVLWQVNTIGKIDRGETITGAPEVAGDVVIIGNGGAEYGVRGYVTAFDVATGEQRWRFYTVPSDPKLGPQHNPALENALATWGKGTRWEVGLGGTVWDAIHYDPEYNAVYIGVGNGGPYHKNKRSASGGDQLFLSSLVALDPSNGRVKWYYQETPGDSWDFTATAPMILTDLMIDDNTVPVIIHAPKNGFMYLIDRRNGKVLRANPIVYQNWADGIDLSTGRPNLTFDLVDYLHEPRIVYPATPGARNWHPASFNPETRLYYGSVQELGNLMFTTPGDKPYRLRALNHDAALIYTPDIIGMLPSLPPFVKDAVEKSPEYQRVRDIPASSELRAIDPLTGKTIWSVQASSWQDRAGVLTTSGGLLFQGDVTGHFNTYDLKDGSLLHSIMTGTSIMAAPMTYRINGMQYIAVMAGWGGGGWPYVPRDSAAYQYSNQGRLIVFKLDGKQVSTPPKLPALQVAPEPPAQAEDVTEKTLTRGKGLFFTHCVMCHANQHRTIAADLRRMSSGIHTIFDQILLEGALLPLGMPRWDDVLSTDDVKDIHAYLIDEQLKTRTFELELKQQGKPLDSTKSSVLSSF